MDNQASTNRVERFNQPTRTDEEEFILTYIQDSEHFDFQEALMLAHQRDQQAARELEAQARGLIELDNLKTSIQGLLRDCPGWESDPHYIERWVHGAYQTLQKINELL